MQIEIHLERDTYANQKWTYAHLTRALSRLYTRFGLAVADYAPNLCQEKQEEPDKMYHNYFDILLVKTDKGNDSKKKKKKEKVDKDEL